MDKRESFVLYSNLKDVLDVLTDEQSGKLFKAIVNYNNGIEPQFDDAVLAMAFIPIKQGLDSNNAAWEETKKARSEAGKKGMEKRWGNRDTKAITGDNKDNNVITNNNKDNAVIEDNPKRAKKPQPEKQAYGELGNVKLTDKEYNTLCEKYGKEIADKAVNKLGWYMDSNHKTYKSHYGAINSWVIDEVTKNRYTAPKQTTATTTDINEYLMRQAMGADYGQTGNI